MLFIHFPFITFPSTALFQMYVPSLLMVTLPLRAPALVLVMYESYVSSVADELGTNILYVCSKWDTSFGLMVNFIVPVVFVPGMLHVPLR
ncbi:hypothetical protein [Aneurinibacillus soli]|uniref:hypothetical protein n=1 Tax=Aneurinibacillus soli TaxID=1500254 RepID=UPI0011B566B4|nr:hypothetical protein [Aneurinibacillus soli]